MNIIRRIEVEINPETFRVNRYPWEDLQNVGDAIVLCGKMLNVESARLCAYLYAKKNKFKVSVIQNKAEGTLVIVRRAAHEWEKVG